MAPRFCGSFGPYKRLKGPCSLDVLRSLNFLTQSALKVSMSFKANERTLNFFGFLIRFLVGFFLGFLIWSFLGFLIWS